MRADNTKGSVDHHYQIWNKYKRKKRERRKIIFSSSYQRNGISFIDTFYSWHELVNFALYCYHLLDILRYHFGVICFFLALQLSLLSWLLAQIVTYRVTLLSISTSWHHNIIIFIDMDEDHKPVVYKFDDMSTSSEGSYTPSEKRKRARLCYALLFLIVIAALATITAGVVLLRNAQDRQLAETLKKEKAALTSTANPTNSTTSPTPSSSLNIFYMKDIKNMDEYCEPSAEAQRIKLNEFLEKCQRLYYKINPHQELVERNTEPQEVLNDIVRR